VSVLCTCLDCADATQADAADKCDMSTIVNVPLLLCSTDPVSHFWGCGCLHRYPTFGDVVVSAKLLRMLHMQHAHNKEYSDQPKAISVRGAVPEVG
jgi:hypothetical protein